MADTNIIACICEGTAERVVVDRLLDEKKLKFSREDLLDNEVLKCRKAREFEDKYLGKGFNKKITVYRILDSYTENFKLRVAYKNKVDVINVITSPEIEMLVIINEGQYKEYQKVKSSTKPSEFCKNQLKMSNVKNYKFISEYFGDVNLLINAINEYKRLTNTRNNTKCLADLLK